MLINTAEPASTREATERKVKIIDSNYDKVDPEQVEDSSSQMKY